MKRRPQGPLLCFLIGLSVLFSDVSFYPVAATTVEDDILEDTTWVAAKSPYLITECVEVYEGATLTIAPGVVTRFNDNSSLTIAGSLLAAGTANARILFTSNQPDPAAGQWSGLESVGGTTESFILEFVDVEYAKNGIILGGSGRAVVKRSEIAKNSLSGIHVVGQSNVLLEENVIKLNGNGLSAAGATLSGIKAVGNSIFANDENGVYFDSKGAKICRIHNVTILDNEIFQNRGGICLLSRGHDEGRIYNVTMSRNTLSSNEYGIRLRTQGWYGGYIHDLVISNNTVSFNEEGIDLYSGSEWYRWISDVLISGNKIFSNQNGISLDGYRVGVPFDPFGLLPFDAVFTENIISANEGKGICVVGDVRANFTGNAISYNSYGLYITTAGNQAVNNDLYQNSMYGMYITDAHVTVDAHVMAEYNYWGASNGPYHEELNPDGMGDTIYGGEENLNFKPFLTEPCGVINEAPMAVLTVNKTVVAANQTILFDGSKSSDDSAILEYFFDFGDGETAQTLHNVIEHEYSSLGNYNASLVVMDDLGVKSINAATEAINVTTLRFMAISLFLSPLSMVSEGEVAVKVHVSEGVLGIREALVQLTSDEGGNFMPASGYTDSNGEFYSTYSVPSVSEPTTLRIVATATKEGYEDTSADANLSVHAPPPGIESVPRWIWFVTIVVAGAAAIVLLLRRNRKTTPREEEAVQAVGQQEISTETCATILTYACEFLCLQALGPTGSPLF